MAKAPRSKLPGTWSASRILRKSEKKHAETLFPFVDIVCESYKTMLIFISYWNLQLNEKDRDHAAKDLKNRIIPDLTFAVERLSEIKRFGYVIANVLYAAASIGLQTAKGLAKVCETGNFQKRGWNSKLAMYVYFEKIFAGEVEKIENAFKANIHDKVLDDVLDDLRHEYVNKWEDATDKMHLHLKAEEDQLKT
jgi:hypothetical protein